MLIAVLMVCTVVLGDIPVDLTNAMHLAASPTHSCCSRLLLRTSMKSNAQISFELKNLITTCNVMHFFRECHYNILKIENMGDMCYQLSE